MFLIIAAIVVVGAFAIVATATAMPISPWRSLIDAEPRADLGLSRPDARSPHEIR
jgi:hypothetical protein